MNRYFGLHTLEGEWHALLPRYILLAERLEGRRVLDIGCGSGIGASMLRELGAEMVDAIDHRPGVLEVARMKHTKEGLDFHVMFWEELDFPDNTFDVVVCLDPSSPVTDPSLIQEVRRVLKSGGEYICAIERKTLAGIEGLLPRYGYVDAAENVDINDAQERVPQLGELHKHFESVNSVVQRPLLAYIFDQDDGGSTTRREGEGSGVWVEDGSSDSEDGGRWLSIDNRLSSNEDDPGSVEIWFCGDDALPTPPLKEIRLPYYGIAERLQQVVGDLQVRGMSGLGTEDSLFEEIVDEPATDDLDARYDVSTFEADEWEAQPTTIHASGVGRQPVPAAAPEPSLEVSQFHRELADLRSLYGQMHGDFQGMLAQAQNALAERDGYIQHLVEQVQHWQSRFTDEAPPSMSPNNDGVTTGVFQKLEMPSHSSDELRDLHSEVARLRDEQRRLAAELAQKNEFLRASDDDSDTSERHSPTRAELGIDDSEVASDAPEPDVPAAAEDDEPQADDAAAQKANDAEEEAPSGDDDDGEPEAAATSDDGSSAEAEEEE